MKVGDYVRTKNGIIGKIESKNLIGYNDWIIDTLYYNDDEIIDDWTCDVKEYDIVKSSPNIIDLIEVGDYVNGLLIKSIGDKFYNCGHTLVYFKDIKSIVTKEMYSSVEYRVEIN